MKSLTSAALPGQHHPTAWPIPTLLLRGSFALSPCYQRNVISCGITSNCSCKWWHLNSTWVNGFGSVQVASPAKSQRCLAVEEMPQSCRCKLEWQTRHIHQFLILTEGLCAANQYYFNWSILTYWYKLLGLPSAGRGECTGRTRDDRWACVTVVLVALQKHIHISDQSQLYLFACSQRVKGCPNFQ